MVENPHPEIGPSPDSEKSMFPDQMALSDVLRTANITPDSSYFERVLGMVASRMKRLVRIESADDLAFRISGARGERLYGDILSFVSILEEADSPDTPARPPEKKYGMWNIDPTKKRKPNDEQALPVTPKDNEEATSTTVIPGGIAVAIRSNGKNAEEARLSADNLLRDMGWFENKRLLGRRKLTNIAKRRGLDISERNFAIPPEHYTVILLELGSPKSEG